MSIIATPPVDRLAVRTFVTPFDPVVVREAILRERDRGGQIFYVAPYISDLDEVREELRAIVPEIRVAVAHGRLAPTELENVMTAFDERAYDLLLSTNIIESGLDIPTANTLIVHRADMFGLAQLYQLRGRVGRGKLRAYCYLTLPEKKKLAPTATRRLDVMQTLGHAWAPGFSSRATISTSAAPAICWATSSPAISARSASNSISTCSRRRSRRPRTSGGVEGQAASEEEWSPQITLGMPVLIPEGYVADLGVRLGLYRRIAQLDSRRERDAFAAELIDRFGPLPREVENLLQIIAIKRDCREAGVERVEAGPKGAVVTLRNNRFANPAGLVELIQKHAGTLRLRPDQKLVYLRNWDDEPTRLKGVSGLLQALVKLARTATERSPAHPDAGTCEGASGRAAIVLKLGIDYFV